MLAHMQSIVAASWDAQETLQVESAWNIMVHSQVLTASLFGSFPRPDLLCAVPCTHARIMKWYFPSVNSSRMVNFALAVNPRLDPDPRVMPAIDALWSRLVFGVVNHTNYDALRERPVAVSIETKRRGEQQSKAEVQMGVWHAAHWAFLASHVKDRLATLFFLPGLLIVGDEWKLVASSYVNGQTILFLDRSIGSTNSELGTLQIMAVLRRLRRWVEETYWPWYKREMLGLD
ncbi:Putative PD-(D/E)XK nuclease [Colletotrichum destructivum]|uniref:PD-(D/E)XK nuclease n=1 Tax=Colletotrichum destructivum TaxID=34406 RepID=A0AAX4J455_9PEZI|nr:Putative PD-(D/E)XK nuclease [Colletotrichum destructivum]